MPVIIDYNVEALVRTARKLANLKLGNLKPKQTEILEAVQSRTRERFDSGGDGEWSPRRPSTIKALSRFGPVNQQAGFRTGKLRAAVTTGLSVKIDGPVAEFVIKDRKIARIAQIFSTGYSKGNRSQDPRPIFKVTPELRETIAKITQELIIKEMRGQLAAD